MGQVSDGKEEIIKITYAVYKNVDGILKYDGTIINKIEMFVAN